jgi:hypothetical protein
MHPLFTAGEAAGEEPLHATCMRSGGQVLPCRRQGLRACRMHPLLMAGDRRRRGTSTGHEARGWHALWLPGAASGAASAHASCIHRCGCRRATGARRLHPWFRAGPAIFKASITELTPQRGANLGSQGCPDWVERQLPLPAPASKKAKGCLRQRDPWD